LSNNIWPDVAKLGNLGVVVDQDEVEVVGQPTYREEYHYQGKHPNDLGKNHFSVKKSLLHPAQREKY
jgi:hypothetical protein